MMQSAVVAHFKITANNKGNVAYLHQNLIDPPLVLERFVTWPF